MLGYIGCNMRWKYETREQREDRLATWHKYFAWYPIGIDGTYHWLEYVERRVYVFMHTPFGEHVITEYRENQPGGFP